MNINKQHPFPKHIGREVLWPMVKYSQGQDDSMATNLIFLGNEVLTKIPCWDT